MPSSLHISPSTTQSRPKGALPSSPVVSSAYKAAKMSITQTYFLAHKARGKLSHEAARPDHNLRLLVGHANLLDSLMLELADAEREQESWFNQSVRGATKSDQERQHIQWADSIVEEPEQDWQAEDADVYSDSDSDSDSDLDEDEDIEMADMVSLTRIPSNQNAKLYYDDDMEEDDDEEEDYAQLALHRSPSHSQSPPELDHDSDSSEDEVMPPSPPTTVLATFSEKDHKETITTTSLFTHTSHEEEQETDKDAFYEQGYYLPPRNPARLVSAISVY